MKYQTFKTGLLAALLTCASTLFASDSSSRENNTAFDQVLALEGISFHIKASNEGSLNQLTIIPAGLSVGNPPLKSEIDGSVTSAKVADLNGDGSPEVYIFITSAGSGSYGSVIAYSTNDKKSVTPITMPELDPDSKAAKGYMGHDEFTIIEKTLTRRFPVYKDNDPNCCPTGGTRQLNYKLIPGETGWQLKLVKIVDLQKEDQ